MQRIILNISPVGINEINIKISEIVIKIGNVFKSKMDLIINNNSESKVSTIKEKLAKYILEH